MYGLANPTHFYAGGSRYTGKLAALLKIGGLTFYKDFTKGGSLNADFSLGSPKATYTSTSGVPTMTGGYNPAAANADVLKYVNTKNRTATQETIIVKCSTPYNVTAGQAYGYLGVIASDTKNRFIEFNQDAGFEFQPNRTDTVACAASWGTFNANTTVVLSFTCSQSSPYAVAYKDGSSIGTPDTTHPFTVNAWGTYFYVGCNETSTGQTEGTIKSITFFNRPLSQSEIIKATNLL
jgi:hypothetical protein